MARVRLHSIRSGPTTVVGDSSSTFTLGSASLADLTAGMANGDCCHVDVVCSVTSVASYSALVTLTVCIDLNAGPVYGLGAVSTSSVNIGGSSPINSGLTLDQNSGNLRVRAVIGGITVVCRTVFNPIGP